jgi:uncharacterized protein GlcG (DUF336 family)
VSTRFGTVRRSLGTTSEVTIHSFARARALTIASIALLAAACGSTSNPNGGTTQAGAPDTLSAADVTAIIKAAAGAISDDMAVAVVDRSGTILGVYSRNAGDATTPNTAAQVSVSLARTTGYFSNNVAPLASRTVRYISGIHFPPAPLPSDGTDLGGVKDAPNAPLYGVENINRGCQLDAAGDAVFSTNTGLRIDRPRSLRGTVLNLPCNPVDQSGCAIGGPIQETDGVTLRYTFGITTGKSDLFDSKEGLEESVNPGAVPIYRNKKHIAGIGVVLAGPRDNAKVEYAAVIGAATSGVGTTTAIDFPNPLPVPGAIFIDGFRLPFVAIPLPPAPGAPEGSFGPPSPPAGSSPGTFNPAQFIYGPLNGRETPTGYLIGPRGSKVGGLTQDEVTKIVDQAVAQANITRAQVRLPYGLTAQFIIAISDLDGTILAEFRMPDALFDAVDVVPSKARNAYYFSTVEGYNVLKSYVDASNGRYRWEPAPPAGQGWALTSRTIGFGGQPLFPPGIDQQKIDQKNNNPGPWFDLFLYDTRNPCTEGPGASRGGNRAGYLNQNGITWFAGSAPLYKNGALVGGIGVSGDGTEQNDLVTQAGAVGFEPPDSLRVDNSTIVTSFLEPVRLPYLKFPRNPEQF